MSAPEGNQFWKIRTKHGRDKLFSSSDILWEEACKYFEWCDKNPWAETTTKTKAIGTKKGVDGKKADDTGKEDVNLIESSNTPIARPYTISGLFIYLGCNTQYLSQFKAALPKDEQDFSLIITCIEEIIYTQKFEGAAVGAFNATIISRDLGLRDKSETEIKLKTINKAEELSDEDLTAIIKGRQ